MSAHYWTCKKCSHRNQRTASRKCQGCGEQTKPKVRMPKHAEVLRGDTYPLFVKAAQEIHGVTDESCCVCGKPRGQERRHDRDHDHVTGQPRGLACAGNRGCNALMPSWLTAERAELIAAYLRRVESFYA